MTPKEIVIKGMKAHGYNQTTLATAAGLKRQTNISGMLRSQSMKVDNWVKLLDTMGFDVIVKDRNMTSEIQWTVGEKSDVIPRNTSSASKYSIGGNKSPDPSEVAFKMYSALDAADQGEIRGEMRQMLKADKYRENMP